MALDGNERKALYRNLINDPATQTETKKYSFTDWERKLLGDEKAIGKLAQFSVGRNWAIDENDFVERYVPEFKSTPAPPTKKATTIPPVGIAAPVAEPAPSMTDMARQMAFQPPVQEPIPSVTETAREMAFKPPVQPKKTAEEEERGFGEWAGDLAGTIYEGGKRITKNLLGGVGYFAQAQAAADPMLNIPYEKKQEMMQEAGQTMYDIAEKAEKDFQAEVAKRNIQTDVLQAIENKQYKKIPEATLYTIGDAAMQIVPALLTGGGSSFMQTLPTAYKEGVEAIAKEKGISPEQVIASGDDAILTATLTSGIVGALDKFGAEKIGTFISTKAGYKAVRDWLLKQNINKKLATAAQLLGVGLGESGTEYLQEGTQQTGAIAAKSPTLAAFFDKLPKELFTVEADRQRRGAAVGGLIGGVGLAGGGRAIVSGLNKLAAKPAATEAAPEAEAVTAEEVAGTGRRVFVDSLEEVPAEYRDKVIEVTGGPLSRFGIGKKQYAYVVPAETIDITEAAPITEAPAAEVTTEEDLAEDIPFEEVPAETEEVVVPTLEEEQDLGFLDESNMTPEEQAAILAQEEAAPVEEEIPAEEVIPVAPTERIAPLNIDFAQNEGRNVNYQGIEGRIKIDSDGAPYVFTKEGDVVYIEGGLSGQTPQQLGVQPLADDVIAEADVEEVIQDENAALDQNQLQYDFDNNAITLYGKPFTYEGVETNSKGQTTALRLRDANGKVKFIRNEDTILEFEIQKEIYEKSRSNKPLTVESATAAAEQLQVVPAERVEQVSRPVQQEGPVGDIEGDEVAAPAAPAPKGGKKKAPAATPPAETKKEEAPKPEPKKEEEAQQEPRAAQKIAAISPTNLQVFKGVVTKDPLKPKMQGVYFDKANQKIVATDGMNMVVIDRDVKTDVIIDPKTGQVIKQAFPDYQAVIPAYYKKAVKNVGIKDLLEKLDTIIKGDKERAESAFATITFDGEEMGITPKVLKAGLKALKELGYETVTIEYESPKKPLLFKTKDGKTILLTMPTFLNDDVDSERKISIGEFALEDIGRPKAEPTPEQVERGFTEGKDLNRIFKASKEKYGEKEGAKYNEAANRLVNPNQNTIIEVRSNGVVVKRGEKYFLLPFTNTDANYKKWELGSRPIEVTEQYAAKPTTQSEVEATAKALEGVDKTKLLKQSGLIDKSERTFYKKYNVGDVIDGNQLDELSGDLVGNQPNKKFVLVQTPLSNFSENREQLLKEEKGYEEEESDRLESMKEDFNKTPPIPMEGDGRHRIIAAKELGHKTILMWQEVSSKSISEAYHAAKKNGSNPELVQAVEELLGKKKAAPVTPAPAAPKKEEAPKPEPKKEEVKPVTEIKDYKGLFNPNKTGVSGIDELLEDDGYQFFYKGKTVERVLMSPDEYLERVRKGLKTKTDANILEGKTDAIKKAIESGAKINAPFISTVGGKFSQEGRNRAVVARELGEQKIPVFIESDVTFDGKINRGTDLVKQSQDKGNKTKEDVLEDIKKSGLHRDGVRFIEENYDAIQEKVSGKAEAKEEKVTPTSKPQEAAVEIAKAFTDRFGIKVNLIDSKGLQDLLSKSENAKEFFFKVLDKIDVFETDNIQEAKNFITTVFQTVESAEDAKRAYRKLAVKYHPDKRGSEEVMKHLNDVNEKYQKGTLGRGAAQQERPSQATKEQRYREWAERMSRQYEADARAYAESSQMGDEQRARESAKAQAEKEAREARAKAAQPTQKETKAEQPKPKPAQPTSKIKKGIIESLVEFFTKPFGAEKTTKGEVLTFESRSKYKQDAWNKRNSLKEENRKNELNRISENLKNYTSDRITTKQYRDNEAAIRSEYANKNKAVDDWYNNTVVAIDKAYEKKIPFAYKQYVGDKVAGLYDPVSLQAYVVLDNLDETTFVHEAFSHPFIEAVKERNNELYNNLLAESKNTQEIVDYVDENYGNAPQQVKDAEYIARAIDLDAKGKLKNKTLIEYVRQFWAEANKIFKDIFGGKGAAIENISPTTKVSDIVDFVLTSGERLDLTKPSTPSFTSEQSSEAATAFDKAKTSKGFDKKHGKGAYKALSDITKNFDAIMDKVSDKIKQDCL